MRSRFSWVLLSAYLIGAAVLLLPTIRTLLDPSTGGMIVYGGDDESSYYARVQESLLHPLSFVDQPNGMWAGAPTLQMARLEHLLGALFSWTGISGTLLSLLAMALIAPLIIPIVAALCRKCGASQWISLGAAVFFFWVLRYLGRPFHPSISLPLTTVALLCLWQWWERPTQRIAFVTGALGAFLTGVYLWSWTYFWAVSGLLVCAALVLPRLPEAKARLRTLPVLIGTAVIGTIPEVLRLAMLWRQPAYAESSERVGFLSSHMLESPKRSALLLVLCVSMFVLLVRRRKLAALAPFAAMLLAALVCLNQQLIHGKVISFSTHYYPYICLVSLLSIVIVVSLRSMRISAIVASLAGVVFLAGAYNDYAGRLVPFQTPDTSWAHLVPAMRTLRDDGVTETVLSDENTSAMIAGVTDDDVAFMPYGNKIVVTTQEYLERYCLSEYVFYQSPSYAQHIAQYMKELTRPGRTQIEDLYRRHRTLAGATCPAVAADLRGALERYGVTMLLWNERLHPEWTIPSLFTLEEQGDGWSMWRIVPA